MDNVILNTPNIYANHYNNSKMQEAGFEPATQKRIVPETIALDHSATLALIIYHYSIIERLLCIISFSTLYTLTITIF